MAKFTKQAIMNCLLELLSTKQLDKITVKDICEICEINRNTFYYYFQDIPQLVETIINEDANRVIQEHPSIESVEDCLNAAIRFALENRKAVLHIYHSINRDIYEQYQWRVCEHAVTTYVDGILAGRTVAEPDRKLMIDYLKCMCFGFVVGWLETGMQEGIQSRFHRICELKRGDLDAMITRCEKK